KLCGYSQSIFIKLGKILTLFQPSLGETTDNKILLEKVLGIVKKFKKEVDEKSIENSIDLLLEIRENARKNKDWKTADAIRDDLDKIGFEIQDTSRGAIWRKK
ncbi:MAG: hypothetical protein JSU91_08510, partial [Thermoplasmatales archaeon]